MFPVNSYSRLEHMRGSHPLKSAVGATRSGLLDDEMQICIFTFLSSSHITYVVPLISLIKQKMFQAIIPESVGVIVSGELMNLPRAVALNSSEREGERR